MSNDELKFFKAFEKWCFNSTLDGLPNIIKARKNVYLFIFWIMMFAICLGLCIFVLTKNIMDFYEYEVTTQDRIVAYDEIKFPIVSICQENPFINPEANNFLENFFNKTLINDYENSMKKRMWALYNLASPSYNNSVKKSIGYSAIELFLNLSFNNNNLDPIKNLEWFFDPTFGNCYRLNVETLYASRAGYGFYAEIFTGLPYDQHSYIYEPLSRGNLNNYSLLI